MGPRQARDAAADPLEARCELEAAAVHGRFFGGRRFEADERLDRFEQPRLLAATEIPQAYNRVHVRACLRPRAGAPDPTCAAAVSRRAASAATCAAGARASAHDYGAAGGHRTGATCAGRADGGA